MLLKNECVGTIFRNDITPPRVPILKLWSLWSFGKMNVYNSFVLMIGNWPNSQIPQRTCPKYHNASFRTEICSFLFWMLYFGIEYWAAALWGLWDWSILRLSTGIRLTRQDWDINTKADIFQTTFSGTFSWRKFCVMLHVTLNIVPKTPRSLLNFPHKGSVISRSLPWHDVGVSQLFTHVASFTNMV